MRGRAKRGCFFRGWRSLRRLRLEDLAQDLIEYALVAALIALMCATALSPVTLALHNGVTKVAKKFKEHVDRGLHKGWYK